jgi:hypothetical protein
VAGADGRLITLEQVIACCHYQQHVYFGARQRAKTDIVAVKKALQAHGLRCGCAACVQRYVHMW